jgi:hypothetical protein
MIAGKPDHVVRGIDSDDLPVRDASGDLRGNLSFAATDIQDAFRTVKLEQAKDFLRHRFLQRRNP